MGLSDLSSGDFIFILQDMTTRGRKVIEDTPKLEPWLGDLEGMLNTLTTASAEEKPQDPENQQEQHDSSRGKRLDRRAEASIHSLFWLLNLAESIALSEDKIENAEKWAKVRNFLFAEGLSMLSASWASQTGETLRLLGLAQDSEIAPYVSKLSVNGRSWADLIELVRKNNDELLKHIEPEVFSSEKDRPLSIAQARRNAVTLLGDFVHVANRALPAHLESSAQPRNLLLSALEERLKSVPDAQ